MALLTAPYYQQAEQADGQAWPEDAPARVDHYNALLHQVAAASGGRVVVLDLGAKLDPGGHFTPTIDGVAVRFADGIHVTPAGRCWCRRGCSPSRPPSAPPTGRRRPRPASTHHDPTGLSRPQPVRAAAAPERSVTVTAMSPTRPT